jgi:hypothetical protein
MSSHPRKPRSVLTSGFYRSIGWFLETLIEPLVRFTGRRVRRADAPWLDRPLGDSVLIDRGIYDRIAALDGKVIEQAELLATY